MALRMKDAECSVCGFRWESLVQTDEPWNPRHCGKLAKKIILAPRIKYLAPHFNTGLGMHIRDAQHLDQELSKRGLFIPNNTDLARAVENAPGDVEPEPDPKLDEVVNRIASDLHNEGKL